MLSDKEIRHRCLTDRPMIEPFHADLVREIDGKRVVSYGTSSYGYDARVANEFTTFPSLLVREGESEILCPKTPVKGAFSWHRVLDYVDIEQHGFLLARTVEYFRIPRDVLALCIGKSTYARLGLVVNCTPLEPEWEGHVTLELSNTANRPIRVWINEGICQFIFLRADQACATSYADRAGKYQGQTGVTLPRI